MRRARDSDSDASSSVCAAPDCCAQQLVVWGVLPVANKSRNGLHAARPNEDTYVAYNLVTRGLAGMGQHRSGCQCSACICAPTGGAATGGGRD